MSETGFQRNPRQESFSSELLSIGQGIGAMLEHMANALTHQSPDRADFLEAAFAGQIIGVEIERLQSGLPENASDLCESKAEQALLQLQSLNKEASEIGRIAQRLRGNAYRRSLLDLSGMTGCVRYMLGTSLEALVSGDSELIEMVALTHEQAEAFAKQLRQQLQSWTVEEPEQAVWVASMLSVVRHLEKIAGHAITVARMVCQKETQASV